MKHKDEIKRVVILIAVIIVFSLIFYFYNGVYARNGVGKVPEKLGTSYKWIYENNKEKFRLQTNNDGEEVSSTYTFSANYINGKKVGTYQIEIYHSNFFFVPDDINVTVWSEGHQKNIEIWEGNIKVSGENVVIYNIKNFKLASEYTDLEDLKISDNIKEIILKKTKR